MAAIDNFTDRLAGLADMSDEELTALESEVMAAFDAADAAEDTAAMESLADALDKVRAEMNSRATEEPAEDAVEASATEETAVAASGINEEEVMAQDRAPKPVNESGNAIIASADIPGVAAGARFEDKDQLYGAFARRIQTMRGLRGGDGEKVLVASVVSSAPEDRVLRFNDPTGNQEKIEAVTGQKAITAAGGFCAPLSTRYDIFTIGETKRPVRDSIPGFQADRGGIRYFQGPTLNSIDISTGIWDSDADAAYDPANPATHKVLGRVDCPTEQTAVTEAITSSLAFGVQAAKVFPENVEANTRLALVQHARIADSNLLSKIKAGSTAVNGPAVTYGAVRDLLLTVARVGAWYRDRHRLDEDVPLRAELPIWVLEVLRSDVIVQPPAGDGRTADFAISARDVENFFDQWKINITWTLDGFDPTANRGGTYGALGATVPDFPTSVQWALFAEGTWMFLDGGSLDLGIVRDASLVRANDYIQFSETFEGIAKVGGESLWITSPLAVRGGYSPAVTVV